MNIVVVGLGYVGLLLALQFCRSGVRVTGLDADPVKVAALLRGESYIRTHDVFAAADAIVVTTAHRVLDYAALLAWAPCVIDTRNAIRTHLDGRVPAGPADRLWHA